MSSEDSTTPDLEQMTALFRTADGIDWVQLARDDASWTAYSQAFAPFLAPDFVYEDDVLPDHVGETYRGIEGWRRAAVTYAEPFDAAIHSLEQIVGSGDRVMCTYRVHATARHTGISFELRLAYLMSFRDGKVVRIQGFRDPDQALAELGPAD